jgi:hypothetical protein
MLDGTSGVSHVSTKSEADKWNIDAPNARKHTGTVKYDMISLQGGLPNTLSESASVLYR